MRGAAQKPLILADRALRTHQDVNMLVELAESLGAPVVDLGSRMNFYSSHDLDCSYLKQSLLRDADVIQILKVGDPWGNLNSGSEPDKEYRPIHKPDIKLIPISMLYLARKSNHQDIQRFMPADLAIGGDAKATLPDLIDAVKRAAPDGAAVAQRRTTYKKMHDNMRAHDRELVAVGFDAVPISTALLTAEMWNVIKNEKWSLVVSDRIPWARRLWPVTEQYQMLGGNGGYGQGGYAPIAVGAALANKEKGIISVTFQPDGDMMYAPGVLWTAAHHKIPLLMLMHNNRCYHQEIMHVQRMAAIHNRPPTSARIGTEITNPDIDFAKIAQGMGVWAEGPITDPAKLGAALRRALDVIKKGQPALLDVICQPR